MFLPDASLRKRLTQGKYSKAYIYPDGVVLREYRHIEEDDLDIWLDIAHAYPAYPCKIYLYRTVQRNQDAPPTPEPTCFVVLDMNFIAYGIQSIGVRLDIRKGYNVTRIELTTADFVTFRTATLHGLTDERIRVYPGFCQESPAAPERYTSIHDWANRQGIVFQLHEESKLTIDEFLREQFNA